MAALVRERCGPEFGSDTALMVGDRWTTDGLFAKALGCPFALVRTGVTPIGIDVPDPPLLDLPDLAAVADAILATVPTSGQSGEGWGGKRGHRSTAVL